MYKLKIITIGILSLFAIIAQAETVYVIDELKIGLHESASINSPIIKLVTSGTELTVIEQNEDLVKVKEPEGSEGWINNKYIVKNKPGKARVNELEKEIELLKSATMMTDGASDNQSDLAQQLKSERLKSGQLQASLADLKAKIAKVDSPDQFLAEIDDLKQENNQLKSQLQSSGIEVESSSVSTGESFISIKGWKQFLIAFIIIIIIGMAAGAFTLDLLNRRRHGGFRI